VKISSRRVVNAAAQRRLDLQADRSKSPAMRDAYPDVGLIQIHLGFSEPQPPPSPQVHSLYPAARAFFRFACPCIDCDGEFDLVAAVTDLVTAGTSARRPGRSVSGRNSCKGIHWRESNHSERCRIEMSFRVVVTFAG